MTPVVSYPADSGVDERQVIDAVLELTQQRVDDVRDDIGTAITNASALVLRFSGLRGMKQHDADALFGRLDTHLGALLQLRQTLQARVDAHLSQQRIAAAIYAEAPQPQPEKVA